MERLLAMSILSSTPADIFGSRTTVSMEKIKEKVCEESSNSSKSTNSDDNWREAENKAEDEKKKPQKQRTQSRFAVEFDGLSCFETIVSR